MQKASSIGHWALRLVALMAGLLLSTCFDAPPAESPHGNYVADWRDEVIYQLMTDRFADGDPNNNWNVDKNILTAWHGGDFQGIIDRITYLQELGITAVWISPVVKVVEEDAGIAGYHGYWTQNFTAVNPHFGDLAKLREMIAALHDAGIKVILDIVANHVGQLFYYDMNKNGNPDEMVMGSSMDCAQYCGHVMGAAQEAGAQICDEEYGGAAFTEGACGAWEGCPNKACHDECVRRCADEGYPYKMGIKRYSEWDPDFDPRGIRSFSEAGESGLAPIRWVFMPEINRVPPEPPEFKNDEWYNRMGRITTWDSRFMTIKGDFPGGLKDLDTTRADVRKALIDVYKYWITALDIDGFRIDTIKHVEHGFWQVFTPAMREHAKNLGKTNFLIFGEAFDGDDELLGLFSQNDEMDSVFYFSQKFQVFDAIFKRGERTKNFEDLWNARKGRYGTRSGVVDENGNALSPQQVLVNFIDNHDLPRFLYDKPDTKALRNALSFLLTTDGIPCIYYGTEQEFSGGNDPANRENLETSGYGTSTATFQFIKDMIALRKEYAPLRRGDLAILHTAEGTGDETDAGIIAFERRYAGETVLVVINAHETKESETSWAEGEVLMTSLRAGTIVDVAPTDGKGATFDVGPDGKVNVTVPPRSIRMLVPR